MGGGKTEIWAKIQDFYTIFLRTIRSQTVYSSGSRICCKVNYPSALSSTLQYHEKQWITNKKSRKFDLFSKEVLFAFKRSLVYNAKKPLLQHKQDSFVNSDYSS